VTMDIIQQSAYYYQSYPVDLTVLNSFLVSCYQRSSVFSFFRGLSGPIFGHVGLGAGGAIAVATLVSFLHRYRSTLSRLLSIIVLDHLDTGPIAYFVVIVGQSRKFGSTHSDTIILYFYGSRLESRIATNLVDVDTLLNQ